MAKKVLKSEKEWKELLSPEQYHVSREGGTERPFTGEYYDSKREGLYRCVCCGNALFDSKAKYDSGTGWPSFFQPRQSESISTKRDESLAIPRTEVLCSLCDAHLGHVFPDGPPPSGLRYCINSISLKFEASEKLEP